MTAEFGGLEILVNNAGVFPFKPIEEFSASEFARVLDVNLKGPWMLSKNALPHLRKSRGSIENIPSASGHYGGASPGGSAYDASKGGLRQLTYSGGGEGEGRTMKLQLSDLDPQVARIFMERVRTLWEQRIENPEALSAAEKDAADAIGRRVDQATRLFRLFDWALPALMCFGGPLVGAVLWQVDPLLGFATGSTVTGALFYGHDRLIDPRKQLEEYVLREEMGTVFPLLELSSAERAYVDALLALSGMEGYIGDEDARRMVGQWNDLLASDRELAARQAEVAQALAGGDSAELAARRDELQRQAGQTTDAETRDALSHSIRMCETQIENAKGFAATRDRLDAQREAIRQTLASLRSTLDRMRLAPREAAAPEVTRLQESLADVTRQTRSVESAVQEVVALRGGAEAAGQG